MISFDVKDIKVKINNAMACVIEITIPSNERFKALDYAAEYKEKPKKLTVEIKRKFEKRSLDANSYFWLVANQIAIAIGITKEEVYRKVIKEVGVFEITLIKKTNLQRWRENWSLRGLGYMTEVIGDSKHYPGYVNVINYYGSSVYNTKEMARLIDSIVTEAHEIGLETMQDEELKSLVESWGK